MKTEKEAADRKEKKLLGHEEFLIACFGSKYEDILLKK